MLNIGRLEHSENVLASTYVGDLMRDPAEVED